MLGKESTRREEGNGQKWVASVCGGTERIGELVVELETRVIIRIVFRIPVARAFLIRTTM